MYSLALKVKVLDRNSKEVDTVIWPLVKADATTWCVGADKTVGTVYGCIRDLAEAQVTLESALLSADPSKNPDIKPLWERIVSASAATAKQDQSRMLKFEIQLISHTPVILDTISLDI